MPDLLLPLLLLLVAVTVIGHGLWLVCARLFNLVVPRDNDLLDTAAASCPRCGTALQAGQCRACAWPNPLGEPSQQTQAALEVIAAQIRRLNAAGALDAPTAKHLLATVAERQATAIRSSVARTAPESPQHAAQAEADAPETVVDAEVVDEPAHPPHQATPPRSSDAAAPPARTPVEQLHPLDRPDEPPTEHPAQPAAPVTVPPLVSEPRTTWTDWLAAFMEERNIRWGELVGGLLIVCCSIALVISFWSEIADRPLLKFLLFNGVTAALFGVGFYSEHRWRLHTTSQGLLTIASMLVPLNFMAIAAFTSAAAGNHPLIITGEVTSAALFATLLFFAGRVLVPGNALWMTGAVMLPSIAQLLVRRFAGPQASIATLWQLAAIPLACYAVGCGWPLAKATQSTRLDEQSANRLFKLLGVASFAALLPLALLLVKTERPLATLHELSAAVSLLGSIPLAFGLAIWQRLESDESVGLRIAGTSVAVLGAVVSLAGLAIAWPTPGFMLPTAAIQCAIFTVVAWRYRVPAAHLLAAACLTTTYLLAVYLFEGRIAWRDQEPLALAEQFVSGSTGALLVPLVLSYAAAAIAALRHGGRTTYRLQTASDAFACTAAGLAAVSVSLVTWFGFGKQGDPVGAAWVYLVYAAAALAWSARSPRALFAWAGAGLLAAGTWQAIVFRYSGSLNLEHVELTALLVYCTACSLMALVAPITRLSKLESRLEEVLWTACFGVSVVAAIWLFAVVPTTTTTVQAIYWSWLAITWLAVGVGARWRPAFTLMQSALTLATVFGVGTVLEQQSWFQQARWPWLDPRTVQALGTSLAGLSLAWIVLRFAARRTLRATDSDAGPHPITALVESPWLSVDRVVSGAMIALLVLLGIFAVLPGAYEELLPRTALTVSQATTAAAESATTPTGQSTAPASPGALASGWGGWLFLAAVLLVVIATAVQTGSTAWLLAALVPAAVVCPMIAARFESQTAVASTLRWTSAAWLVLASVPILARHALARALPQAARLWQFSPSLRRQATMLVLLLGVLPPLAVLLYIAVPALEAAPIYLNWPELRFALAGVLGIALGVAIINWVAAQNRSPAEPTGSRPVWPVLGVAMSLSIACISVVGLGVDQLARAVVARPIVGPDASSVFGSMHIAVSYGVPVLVVAGVLVGYAFSLRSRGFALAGGLVLGSAATIAAMLVMLTGRWNFDAALWIRVAQINTIVAACYAIGWLVVQQRIRRARSLRRSLPLDYALAAQIALAPALMILVLGWSWADVFFYPTGHAAQSQVMHVGLVDVWGWIGVGSAIIVLGATAWAAGRRVSMAALTGLLTALATMAAAVAGRWDIGDWLAYDTLLTGHMVIVGILLAVTWHDRTVARRLGMSNANDPALPNSAARPWLVGSSTSVWVDAARAVVFILAARQLSDSSWWPVAGFVVLAVTGALCAWVFGRRRYLYDAALMINVAGSTAWLEVDWLPGLTNFVLANIILLAAPVPLWLLIDRLGIRERTAGSRFSVAPAYRSATRLAIAALAIVVGVGLSADAAQVTLIDPAAGMLWAALVATAVAAIACLWDDSAGSAVPRIYVLGLVAVGMTVHLLALSPEWLLWSATMVLAAYALAASYLWSVRAGLRSIAERLRMSTDRDAQFAGLAWLVPANLMLVAAVIGLTGLVEWTQPDVSLRVLASQAVLAQIVSVALIARGDRRGTLQQLTLALGALGAVMFGWAWLVPGTTGTLLHALTVMAAALALVAAFYGLGLSKLLAATNDWLAPAQRLTPPLVGLCAASLVAVLGTEAYQYADAGIVEIAPLAIATVAVTLIGLCAAALAAALLPGRDPLGLSPRGRTAYVYAAEIALAMLFGHIRMSMPWLFSGFFQQYWPLIVMAIAFAGVGFAELCRRYRQEVLAEPFQNTGALLPLLPVLGYWAGDVSVDYSVVLLVVGGLYAALSVLRKSFGFGVLAALAANAGLWYFLGRQDGFGFLVHPQVWLIPPALCVLAAAYLNRSQLSDDQMTTLRYLASMMIYLSSTADIFLVGVAQAPWLPLVLGGLSIAGILAGIALRVRAFLLLGTGFLGLALCTIIWHAAVDLDQTWILYACGIVAGVLIIALFAMFEKKRRDVLDVFERIRQWEA